MAPDLAPHQVYSEELAGCFKRGHPIAVPHPGVRDGQVARAVGIGDVGYIQYVLLALLWPYHAK